jgi:hypothetical protein
MKKIKPLTILGLAAGAWLLFRTKNSSASSSGGFVSNFPAAAVELSSSAANQAGKNSTVSTAYTDAISSFEKTPVNTTASINAGINVINTAISGGVQLPQLSATLAKVSENSNVARLADNSIKLVTVKEASKNNAGQTAIDIQIAKNFAALATK